jgi:hypothetical protein
LSRMAALYAEGGLAPVAAARRTLAA